MKHLLFTVFAAAADCNYSVRPSQVQNMDARFRTSFPERHWLNHHWVLQDNCCLIQLGWRHLGSCKGLWIRWLARTSLQVPRDVGWSYDVGSSYRPINAAKQLTNKTTSFDNFFKAFRHLYYRLRYWESRQAFQSFTTHKLTGLAHLTALPRLRTSVLY